MPLGFFLNFTAKQGCGAELRTHLIEAVERSRKEPGNLLCVLMEDPQDADRFSIYEIYRDEEAIAEHQSADYTKQSAPVIHALFAKPMEIIRLVTVNWPSQKRVTFQEGDVE